MKVNKGYITKLHNIFQKNLVLDGIAFILNLCQETRPTWYMCWESASIRQVQDDALLYKEKDIITFTPSDMN